jgi:hypothetical protein
MSNTIEYKYAFIVFTNFHIENFLVDNNTTNDSFFWNEGADEDGNRTLYFTSSLLNNLTDIQEIYDKANQILSIYIGIYRLLDRNESMKLYFTLGKLIDLEDNRVIETERKSELYKIEVDFKLIVKKPENKLRNPIYILFEKITSDEFLINLFFLISRSLDYKMLYIIYDDIRYFLKEVKDNTFLDSDMSQLKKFTHTANNYEVLGFFARHGRTFHDAPKDPMNLDDSMNLIFDIIVRLLYQKFEIELPKYWGLIYIKYDPII